MYKTSKKVILRYQIPSLDSSGLGLPKCHWSQACHYHQQKYPGIVLNKFNLIAMVKSFIALFARSRMTQFDEVSGT